MDRPIRVGLAGAGQNARINIIPSLQSMHGVEVVSVVNRSRESSERVAQEFNIPNVYDNWLDLVKAPDTNAIYVGTFPDTHHAITLAALEADKHVLCESRMTNTAWEARSMLESSRKKPHLTVQIIPAPATFQVDNLVIDLVSNSYLGDILAANMMVGRSIDNPVPGGFADFDSPQVWRQDWLTHGYNAMGLGIHYEALMRWIGPATRVLANAKTFILQRRGPDGTFQAVTLPDHVEVLCDMACGAQANITVSSVLGLSPHHQTWLFGTQGTLLISASPSQTYLARDSESDTAATSLSRSTTTDRAFQQDVHYKRHTIFRVYGARRGEQELKEIPNPVEKRYTWRVTQEWTNAIMGKERVTRTPFETGVMYMEFVEASLRSAQTGRAIPLPL